MTQGWTPPAGGYPIPPINGQVVNPYLRGVHDLRWDDPSLLPDNTAFTIVGVNIYRSDASDLGPYFRINPYPISGTFYRDLTDNTMVSKEIVRWDTSWVSKGASANDRSWIFRTANPIVKSVSNAPFQSVTMADSPSDVTLYVDDVEVPVENVFGPNGEVTLINQATVDPATEQLISAILPTIDSTVTITYYTNRNHVRSGLDAKIHYRLTTVALDSTTPSGYTETPLKYCQPYTNIAVETLDYIWREAMRRNNWILEQGGERVKAFVKKMSGIPCTCQMDERTLEFSQMPRNSCLDCYGTGYVGGYEGPYEMIIGPDDAERRISQQVSGRRMEHTYEIWMGPSPLLTQRDFIVKQTNERYSVGPVRRPSNRGNVLQQHFNIAYIDEGDIRYKMPIVGYTELPWPQTRQERDPDVPFPVIGTRYEPRQEGVHKATPMETEKSGIPDEREQRGRTPTWENQQY